MDLDREACYRAVAARDRRFDGRFFTGVLSTGIFCRPICPARTPKFENCVFFPTAAAAYSAGFRPCLRCRPEISPGVPAWNGTAFELAVRAILGQQVSVAAASTLAGRLAATFGEQGGPTSGGLRVLFPGPKALAHADLSSIGLPGARASAISSLAAAVMRDPALLRTIPWSSPSPDCSRSPASASGQEPTSRCARYGSRTHFPRRILGFSVP